MSGKIRIRQVKSAGGHTGDQRRTMWALRLRTMHQAVEHDDTPQIRGMIFKVRHLVRVEEVEG